MLISSKIKLCTDKKETIGFFRSSQKQELKLSLVLGHEP